jgi:prevent-host-death family protein
MKRYNIAEAKSHFSELVKKSLMGEEIVIARDNKPLIKLVPLSEVKKKRRPGSGKGQVTYIAPDFDELPVDFKDYT